MRRPAVLLAALAAFALPGAALPAAAAQPDMVSIPGGPFLMGSAEGPPDERPPHEVTVADFSIDRFPVTNAEFAAFLNAAAALPRDRPYDFDDPDARIRQREGRWAPDAGYERHPVNEVPWAGALAYCKWRGKRLPTEAEWEKAARGVDARRYPWGNDLPDARRARYGAGWNQTAPVDATPAGASAYGAHDMAGNVWEWVSSAYRPYPYRADDGREDLTPGPVRGTRGGGHGSRAEELTATHRGRHVSRNPAAGHHNIGFRCAR